MIDIRITATIKHRSEEKKEFSYTELKRIEDLLMLFEQIHGLNFKYQIACDRNFYRTIKEKVIIEQSKGLEKIENKTVDKEKVTDLKELKEFETKRENDIREMERLVNQ